MNSQFGSARTRADVKSNHPVEVASASSEEFSASQQGRRPQVPVSGRRGKPPLFQGSILAKTSIARAGLVHWKANQAPNLMICHQIHL